MHCPLFFNVQDGGHGAPMSEGRAPQYLAVHCVPLSSQRHLHSAKRNLLHMPHHRLNMYGCWSIRLEQSSGPCPQPEHHWSCWKLFVHAVLTYRMGCIRKVHWWCCIKIYLLKLTVITLNKLENNFVVQSVNSRMTTQALWNCTL